jgi:hypothetical protein
VIQEVCCNSDSVETVMNSGSFEEDVPVEAYLTKKWKD